MFYSPVRHSDDESSAFDLHVLGTPPAFILSQDQTLHCPIQWSLHLALYDFSGLMALSIIVARHPLATLIV